MLHSHPNRLVQEALAAANARATEVLSLHATVAAFGAEELEFSRYAGRLQRHFALNVRQLMITGIYYMTMNVGFGGVRWRGGVEALLCAAAAAAAAPPPPPHQI